jgi:hypothetical protein
LYRIDLKPKTVIATLSALAHEHRLAIYRLLVTRGPEGFAHTERAERPS